MIQAGLARATAVRTNADTNAVVVAATNAGDSPITIGNQGVGVAEFSEPIEKSALNAAQRSAERGKTGQDTEGNRASQVSRRVGDGQGERQARG